MNPEPSRPHTRPAACPAAAGSAKRLALLLLAFFIALQSLAMSTQRAGGRLHYHLAQVDSTGHAGVDEHADAEHGHEDLQAQEDEHDHDHEHAHPYGGVAEHDHAIDRPDVVHVAQADGGGSPQPQANPPRLTDLDGLAARPAAVLAPDRAARWPQPPALLIRSFDGPPLERPPSRRA